MRPAQDFPCVLGADVGGTKTLLRLVGIEDGRPAGTLHEARADSATSASLTPLIERFLQGRPRPQAACIAVAAPISGRRLRLTNLALTVDADEIAAACGIGRVTLINDFVAVGYGIETLGPDDALTLQAGRPAPRAPRVVLGAGTGLGVAQLFWRGDHYEVMPSEGGHVDFAPTDDEQIGLLRFLAARHGHVSCERILSGPGLMALFEFFGQGADLDPQLVEAVRETGAAAVTRAALAGDAVAARALDLFIRIYGATAGNLALIAWARGGVYVAGGIAARMPERFTQGGFIGAFCAKGRYREALAEMPVHLVLRPEVGLDGAVAVAARSLSRPSST